MSSVAELLYALTGMTIRGEPLRVSGGSISDAYRCQTNLGPVFLKTAPAASIDTFNAEAAGLEALRSADAVRVPQVIGLGAKGELSGLALEWLELRQGSDRCAAQLGQSLAKLHRVSGPAFGWTRDNYIGSTPQLNRAEDDWPTFFKAQRLEPQLKQALRQGASSELIERGEQLCQSLDHFFAGHRPLPSLLHGDLWGGNWSATLDDQPVMFDPACYWGDRETDIAMTRLFGGFPPSFYAAYEHEWPLDAGASERRALYNLYHVLNHFNLFGSDYERQAVSMIHALLNSIR
jgi:protein-ribulosamine 3-kinase